MSKEVAVFHREQRVNDVVGNLRKQRLLAVLRLEHADLATLHVVHHAAFGEPCEAADLIERNRGLVVGVQHAPHPRGHAHHERGDQQGRKQHGDHESQRPDC